MIASPRDKHSGDSEGSTSPHAAAAGTSYLFFVSKDPPLQSVLFGVRTGGHAPAADVP